MVFSVFNFIIWIYSYDAIVCSFVAVLGYDEFTHICTHFNIISSKGGPSRRKIVLIG